MKISFVTRCAVVAVALAAVAAPAAAGGPQKPDPFKRNVKPNTPVPKPKESIVAPPALAVRKDECKGSASAGKQVETLPCMYLVGEVKLQGVFRSEDQPEAFLYAEPTKQTVMVRVGDRFYDGRVVSIDEPGPNGNGSVVLEKVTKRQVGKKITETKELVTLALTTAGI
jgi:hypothetical protein